MRLSPVLVSVVSAAASAAALSCWVGSSPSSDASVAAGEALTQSLACASCHGADLAGSDTPIGFGSSLAFAPNLTPDEATGLGSWSDDDVARAFRAGVDDEGAPLCSAMPRFDALDDGQAASIVAYLRSLPAKKHGVAESHCAPPADLDDAGLDDAGVVIVTDDAPACDGFADPSVASACHACSGATCQPNGCFGGWYCDLATLHCVSKPAGC
jgi:mono/diheme cytochrome c family protein